MGNKNNKSRELFCPECGSENVTWHGQKNDSHYECTDCTHKFGRENWGKDRKNKNWYGD